MAGATVRVEVVATEKVRIEDSYTEERCGAALA